MGARKRTARMDTGIEGSKSRFEIFWTRVMEEHE